MNGTTVNGLVTEALASSERELLDEVARLTAERHAFRELAQAAIQDLAEKHRAYTQLQSQLARLRDELRSLRDEPAVVLAKDLGGRGIRLKSEGGKLLASPRTLITEEDAAVIAKHRASLVRYVEKTQRKKLEAWW